MSEFGGLWKHEETQYAPTVPESSIDEGGHLMKEEDIALHAAPADRAFNYVVSGFIQLNFFPQTSPILNSGMCHKL